MLRHGPPRRILPESIEDVEGALEEAGVELTLPRFGTETRVELAPALTEVGMSEAFGSDADFSGIFGDFSVAIARVIHQANIDLDEIGTEAAAATSIGFDEADQPFIYALRDLPTGAILFMGRVPDPSLE
jgi:serine protease inhibitor